MQLKDRLRGIPPDSMRSAVSALVRSTYTRAHDLVRSLGEDTSPEFRQALLDDLGEVIEEANDLLKLSLNGDERARMEMISKMNRTRESIIARSTHRNQNRFPKD